MLARPVSGGCINPAVCIGINLTDFFDGGNISALSWIWLYAAMPLAGSIAAILFYETLYKKILIDSLDSLSMEEEFYDRKGSDEDAKILLNAGRKMSSPVGTPKEDKKEALLDNVEGEDLTKGDDSS